MKSWRSDDFKSLQKSLSFWYDNNHWDRDMKKIAIMLFALLLTRGAAMFLAKFSCSADYGVLPDNYQQQIKDWEGC